MDNTAMPTVQLNHRLMPDYYPDFQCLADACQDTCCRGWRINLSKNDYMTLRRACHTPALKARLQEGVRRVRGEDSSDTDYARFQLRDTGCTFLGETGLCGLQLEFGHDTLPEICRTFPRKITALPTGERAYCCSTACEAVTQVLYQRRDGLGFIQEPVPPKEQKMAMFALTGPLAEHFGALRELCIDILQDRTLSLPDRLLVLGLTLQDLTARTPEELGDLQRWLVDRRGRNETPQVRALIQQLPGNKEFFVWNNVQQMLKQSELLGKMDELRAYCYHFLELNREGADGEATLEMGHYLQGEKDFEGHYGDLEYFFENMLVNAVFQCNYPLGGDDTSIWENYVKLCTFYSALRFMSVCYCAKSGGLDRLIHVMTMLSRDFLHSQSVPKAFWEQMKKHGNEKLVDMAVLVRG